MLFCFIKLEKDTKNYVEYLYLYFLKLNQI